MDPVKFKSQNLFLPVSVPAVVVSLKVEPGCQIRNGTLLATYMLKEGSEELSLRSTLTGKVSSILCKEGSTLQLNEPVLSVVVKCNHSIVVFDMCADCGLDLRRRASSSDDFPQLVSEVRVIHGMPELRVSQKEAEDLGRKDYLRLLSNRKLALIVDLDQTLVHTSMDSNIEPGLPDVYGFHLPDHHLLYHCRLRPHTRQFLNKVSKLFELHVFTMGTKSYAACVTHILDPERCFFSDRIISRDECFDPRSKVLRLKSLFPCGDSLVAIIDDREDVWGRSPNLIHVKPYLFFSGTADINAPPSHSVRRHLSRSHPQHRQKGGKEITVSNPLPFKTRRIVKRITNRNIAVRQREGIAVSTEQVSSALDILREKNEDARVEPDEAEPSRDSVNQCEDACDSLSHVDIVTVQDGLHLTCEDVRSSCSNELPSTETACDSNNNNNNNNNADGVSEDGVNSNSSDSSSDISSSSSSGIDDTLFDDSANEADQEDKRASGRTSNDGNVASSESPSATEVATNSTAPTSQALSDVSSPSMISPEVSATAGTSVPSVPVPPPNTVRGRANKRQPREIHDPDIFLLQLANILERVHAIFYERFDVATKDVDIVTSTDYSIPDLKQIIPELRHSILKDCRILFTGVIPTNTPPRKNAEWRTAKAFGATIHNQLVPGLDSSNEAEVLRATTHVIAGKPGTSKLLEAKKHPGVKIVSPKWLWACAEQWERVEETAYPLAFAKGRGKYEEAGRVLQKKIKLRADKVPGEKQQPTTNVNNMKLLDVETQCLGLREAGTILSEVSDIDDSDSDDIKDAALNILAKMDTTELKRHLSMESRLSVSDEDLVQMEAEVEAEISESESSSSSDGGEGEDLGSHVEAVTENSEEMSYETFAGTNSSEDLDVILEHVSRKRKFADLEGSSSSESVAVETWMNESFVSDKDLSTNVSGEEEEDELSKLLGF